MNSRFKIFIVTSSTLLVVLLLAGATISKSAQQQSEDAYRHLAVYTEVLSRIKSDYVEEPDIKNVTLGAVNGLLEAIDPYASYLNADQYKQYLKNKGSDKADVGLVLSKKFGYVGVVSAIPGSPAAKAGLTTGDLLETISGVATRDMPLAYAELLMKGDPGSSVEISVLRVRKPEPQKITLQRAAVKLPAVVAKMAGDGVGAIQVQALDGARLQDVQRAVADLEKQGARKLVLDLRWCATGSPDEGVLLANLFLNKGLIGYVQGQKVARHNLEAQAEKAVTQEPLAVITNRGTAGAAEVAAAALLDSQRAHVIGERTYGDAAQRKAVTLEDGSAVILSVAKYYSPSGKAIQDTGVTPSDPVVEAEPAAQEQDEDRQDAAPEAPKKPAEDLLLKRALEVLASGKTPAAPAAAAGERKDRGAAPEMPPLNIPNSPRPNQH